MKILAGAAILAATLAAAAHAQENSYLEVPIEGRFGDQVTAQGLEDSLKTAQCIGVKHIVFTVDSKGGDQVAARDLYNLLRKYDKAFRFHAVVREATGVALAVVVWCDTVFIRPGGNVGGVNLTIDEARYPGIETSVVLQNIALNASEEARRHGRSAELVRAMIDPEEAVYGWKDGEGREHVSRWVPSDVNGPQFVVQHQAGKVLTLTDRQAVELGFARAFEGKVADLGCELGLAGWNSAGDAGRQAMAVATRAEQIRGADARNDRQQFLIDQNLRRRNATKASIERFLSLAHEWQPKLGTYSTYKETGHYWDNFWEGWTLDAGRLTPESRQKWRDRTDITVTALSKARGGALEMKFLEKEALELGQPTLYPEGKLEGIRQDLEIKIAMLVRERDKRFKDDK
jgi:hypothetical protein